MTEIVAGFTLGIAGSVHCAAMCGPLVVALRPVRTPGRVALYHAARVTVYAVAGLIAGVIGHASQMVGIGRVLSIAAGVWLLMLAARRVGLSIALPSNNRVSSSITHALITLRRRTGDRPVAGAITAGALNALLPCGLLYAALTAAIGFGAATSAVSFMLSFGLGTVPALAAISALARIVPQAARSRLRFVTPLALALVGALLIARGTIIPHAHDDRPGQPANHLHVH